MPIILLNLQFWVVVCMCISPVVRWGSPQSRHREAAINAFPRFGWHICRSHPLRLGSWAPQHRPMQRVRCQGSAAAPTAAFTWGHTGDTDPDPISSHGGYILLGQNKWFNYWILITPHCLLPCFCPCRIFHPLKPTKRSYFASVSETSSFFPDFPFHAAWILLRSLCTKAEYQLYDALRDLKSCCHNVAKLWRHFIFTRSSLEDCG